LGVIVLRTDWPLAALGRAVQSVRNRLTGGRRPALATLAYRIASYWLPLLAGPPAYLFFRHRYGKTVRRRATPSGAA
jgi:uncharacterized membrane protein YbhN (UPF0104 family)